MPYWYKSQAHQISFQNSRCSITHQTYVCFGSHDVYHIRLSKNTSHQIIKDPDTAPVFSVIIGVNRVYHSCEGRSLAAVPGLTAMRATLLIQSELDIINYSLSPTKVFLKGKK